MNQVSHTEQLQVKKYKNIIFDLGGVLIDWRPKDFLQAIFSEQPEVFQAFARGMQGDVKHLLEEVGKAANRGTMTVNQFGQTLADALNLDPTYADQYVQNLPSYLKPIESGLDLVDRVKKAGHKLYILSNFPREWFDPIEQRYDFFKQFDGGVISYRVGYVKPEPEVYNTLLTKYNLVAHESLFIDDLEQNIVAGQACGIDGIICTDHAFVYQELVRLGVIS